MSGSREARPSGEGGCQGKEQGWPHLPTHALGASPAREQSRVGAGQRTPRIPDFVQAGRRP